MKWVLCFVLAFALFVPDPAAAGPVVAAFQVAAAAFSGGAGLLGAAAAGFGAIASTFVGKLVVGIGLSLVGQLFAKKPRMGINETGIQTEQTTTGDTTPQKFVVGRYAVEGHAVAPAYSRGNNNRILTYILEVSNIPVTGITGRVVVDGQWTDLTEPTDGDESGRLDFGDLGTDDAGNPYGWLWFYDGTQTTAQFKLVEAYSEHPDRPWSDDHILAGTAYAVCEFAYDREVYSGLPSIRFEVDGVSLYDPRKDSSVGGSGTHRWDDPDTWEFTQNPQVINYNILRGITLPSGEVYGGEVPASDLPLDNWFAAMNECDVLIGDRPQYQAGFEINTNEMEPFEVIEEMNRASFAQMSEFGGVFRVRVGAPAAAVMSLTDADFNITEPSSYVPFPGLDQTFNACTGSYVDPNSVWESRSAEAVINTDWEASDGGRRLPVDLNLPAVSNKSQAQQLLTAYIKDQRRFRVHRMVLPPSFALIEPLDSLSWTSETNGYTDKIFEVIDVEHRADTLSQSITVRERDSEDVEWGEADDVPDSTPFGDLTAPDRITPTLTVTAVDQTDGDGDARRTAIKIEWPVDQAPSAELLKYEIRLLGDTVNLVTTATVGRDSGKTVTTDGILPDEIYEVRARYISGLPMAWSAWVPVTTKDTRLSAKDIVDALNEMIEQAFARHDQALETLTSGSVFQLLQEVRIEDAILAAQDVIASGHSVVEQEQSDDAFAAIVAEQEARVTADEAVATNFEGLLTEFGEDVDAAFVAEQTARSTADSAIVSDVTALTARVGTAEGNISNIQSTKVDANGAVSAVEQEISAEYGNLSAMATATAFAEAQADGIAAGYVWELNGSNILELVSVQDGVGSTPVSTARIAADYVQITGLTQIDQAVINNLAVDNGFISNLEVDTLQLAGNSVTATDFAQLGSNLSGNGSFRYVMGAFINVPRNETVELLIVASMAQGYSSGARTWGFQIETTRTGMVLQRDGMQAINDYPTVSAITSWTNNTASDQNIAVLLNWKGQDSTVTLGSSTTLSVMARWR